MKRISLLVISLSLLLVPVAAFAQVGADQPATTGSVSCPPGINDSNCIPSGNSSAASNAQTNPTTDPYYGPLNNSVTSPTNPTPTSQTVVPSSQSSGLPPSQTSGAVTQTSNSSAGSGGSGSVTNPLGGINSFCGLIKAILSAVIAIGIPIAVLFIVFAGFKFVLAQGNPKALEEARRNLMYTLIGIGIFLGAWLLALVIANTVNSLGAGAVQGQIVSCN